MDQMKTISMMTQREIMLFIGKPKGRSMMISDDPDRLQSAGHAGSSCNSSSYVFVGTTGRILECKGKVED